VNVAVRPGLLVKDDHSRIGIVRQPEKVPSRRWLQELEHAEQVAALPADVRWWGVLPLDGGYVISPEPFLEVLREATYEDFLAAVDHANDVARRTLADLFPDYVRRIVSGGDGV
jgi:hypothetical protein